MSGSDTRSTGRWFTEDRMERWSELCREHSAFIQEDERETIAKFETLTIMELVKV